MRGCAAQPHSREHRVSTTVCQCAMVSATGGRDWRSVLRRDGFSEQVDDNSPSLLAGLVHLDVSGAARLRAGPRGIAHRAAFWSLANDATAAGAGVLLVGPSTRQWLWPFRSYRPRLERKALPSAAAVESVASMAVSPMRVVTGAARREQSSPSVASVPASGGDNPVPSAPSEVGGPVHR